MNRTTLYNLLHKDVDTAAKPFALIDGAATAAFTHDDEIFDRLSEPDVEKHHLFAGESAWTAQRAAPYLVPLENRPEIEKWLVEKGWGRSWGIYFVAEADVKTLLAHLRRFFEVKAENGRNVFFRFLDPVILREFLPMLSAPESKFFFGPIRRFVVEDESGKPLVFDQPEGEPSADLDPSRLVLDKRHHFSAAWNRRLMALHQKAFEAMGLTVIADPERNALTVEEKDASRATLQKTDRGVAVTTGEGRVFQYELTPCKNPSAVVDPAGSRIELDIQDREDKVTGHKQSLLQAIRMDGNRKTWVFDYDENNHLARIDYPDGTRASNQIDSYGNLRVHTDRNGSATSFDLDEHERLTRMVDANGHATIFDYDDRTAPSRIRFADGATFEFAYTDAGRLKSFIANDRRVADYEVDADSGSWTVNYSDGTRASFTVENGKVVRAENPAGVLELSYDDQGRLIAETFNRQTVTYQRNASGQLTGITGPLGQTIAYARDGEQRVTGITDWNGNTIDVAYALNGALERIDYPNGARLTQHTAPCGLPEEMTLISPAADGPVFKRRFERDLLDRAVRMQDGKKSIAYSYDKQGRLLGADSDQAEFCESFTLDTKANRLADRHGSYLINAADRIDQPGFAYDALGNQTQAQGPKGQAAYSWNEANRLSAATVQNTQARYVYDAFGRRVGKHADGRKTRTIWAGAQPLTEIVSDDTGERVIDYLFFPGTPVLLAMKNGHELHYAAFGHRYETLCLTDADGTVVWQADYDAFGNAHIEKGRTVFQPFRLAGHYQDPETGLHYCAARYYDPRLGRYLSLDPLFLEGGGDNFYAYCDGDPINRLDPTGEFIFCAILIGAAIGAAVGAGIEAYRQHRAGGATDGFKIAKAALIGGAIGAIGGGVGAVVEAGVAAGAAGTVLAKSALTTMAVSGFLSGAASSVAEQCTQAAITDNAVPPLEIVKQSLTDGVIGAALGVITFGIGGFIARRLKIAATAVTHDIPVEQTVHLQQNARKQVAHASSEARINGRKNTDHGDISTTGEPVNAVTGEVVLTQTDFTLPGRIPLAWTRHYGSQCDYDGLLGPGWQTPADARLQLEDGMVVFYDGGPGGAVFEKLPTDAPLIEMTNGAVLSVEDDGYRVRLKSGLTYHIDRDFTADLSPVTRIEDPSGNALRFVRKQGVLTQIQSGSQTIEIACEHGRIAKMLHNGKPLVSYVYEGQRLVAATDSIGQPKRYAYQKARMIRHSDRNGLAFHYEYDSKGRCIHSYGDGGLYGYRFAYPDYERRTEVTNSLGHVWHYHYDADRLPIKVIDGTGAATIFTYDEVGRIVQVTDPLDRITEYDFDPAGNVIEITRPDHSRMVLIYDDQNRPVQILDPNDKIWQQRFDEKGRLIEKTSPLGHATRYAYDRNGDLVTVTDPNGRTTTFSWDNNGLIESVIDPIGRTTRYRRDPLGNITAVTDPAGRTTRYSYDEKSRLQAVVSPTGLRQNFAWDPEDNLLLHTDAAGRRTRLEYTGVNEISRRINPDGTSVQYLYDSEEHLTGVTNEKGQTHRFDYDAASRVAAQTDYYGHNHHYAYDAAGQLIKSIDPLEKTIAYAYDPAGRLIEKLFESEEREAFKWDPAGNLIAFESPAARIERTFDPDGRLIAEKSPAFDVRYTFDPAGQLTERTTSCGNTIGYAYDDNGAVSAIRINDLPPIRYERNALGQITAERLSEKLTRTLVYDEEGRLSHQRSASPTNLIERRYDYDLAGQLIGRKDSAKGSMRFDYDPMSRIVESIDPMGTVSCFAYDPAGDLLSHLPEPQKGLRAATFKDSTYRFDASGNLVERSVGAKNLSPLQTTRFEWDEKNRLRTIRIADDTFVRMAYDALGRRIQKSVDGERTFFAWDGDALLAEKFEDQPAREYVYYPGTFEPLAVIDGDGQVYYYHNDINGLPQELTKANGDVVWSASYDALGRVERLLVDEVAQPLRLQGQYFDDETGLCYNRYRYFDPLICSFLSQDPIGLVGGVNFYAYAPNVWGWVDPLGLSCKMAAPPASSFDDLIKDLPTDRPLVVVGESMGRVNKVAERLKNAGYEVKTYDPRNFRSFTSTNPGVHPLDLEANRSWLMYWTKSKNASVIDIGLDSKRTLPKSPFYQMENRSLYSNWEYANVAQYDPGF